MALYRKRLQRLEGITAVQEEAWTQEAVARLTDRELHVLHDALQDENCAFGPEEQAALERFSEFYAEACRGG